MPLYEEKLISPLAIRFTQQRIREIFRDGREIEATIKEMTAGPGVGDYDVVLTAPFPTIEIIRWSPNGRSSSSKEEHWFTFDNRRLYCLQRLAAQYWPKRVGATVEVLYADSGGIRKKLDSQTCGMSVTIGHAFATSSQLKEWKWQQAVKKKSKLDSILVAKAEQAVLADDAKMSVADLSEAPAKNSAVDRLDVDVAKMLSEAAGAHMETSQFPRCDAALVKESCKSGNDNIVSAAAPSSGNVALANLIGQLLDLKKVEAQDLVIDGGSTSASLHSEPDSDDVVAKHFSMDAVGTEERVFKAQCEASATTELQAAQNHATTMSGNLSLGGSSLEGLIGQLLHLEASSREEPKENVIDGANRLLEPQSDSTAEPPGLCHDVPEPPGLCHDVPESQITEPPGLCHDVPDDASTSLSPSYAAEDNSVHVDASSSSDTQPLEDNSLGSLLGQLLDIRVKEVTEADHSPELAGGIMSTSSLPSSGPVESVLSASAAPFTFTEDQCGYPPGLAACSNAAPTSTKQKSISKSSAKDNRLSQRIQASLALEAAQCEMMAQQLASQWQMAQLHEANMMQWQHAWQAQAWQPETTGW